MQFRELIRERLQRSSTLQVPRGQRFMTEPSHSAQKVVSKSKRTLEEYKRFVSNHHRRIRTQMQEEEEEQQRQKERQRQALQPIARTSFKLRRSTINSNHFFKFYDGKKSLCYHASQTQVYRLEVENEPQVFAVKVIEVDDKTAMRELYYLKLLRHPNIIELKHHWITQNKKGYTRMHMVFPFYHCTVKQYIKRFPRHNRIVLKLIIYQMIRAVSYIHAKGVTHRDLHLGNFMLDLDTLEVRLIDFGNAKVLQRGDSSTSYIGSRNHRAPELLLGATEYITPVDVWALGCCIFELYYNRSLFNGQNSMETLADIIKLLGTPTSDDLSSMKVPVTSLHMPSIKKQRVADLFPHNDGLSELLDQMFQYKPEDRISSSAALIHPFFNELKHPNIRINQRSLPNIFNFTDDELNDPILRDNLYRMVPQWYSEKVKRAELFKTNFEDALLVMKM